MRPNRLLAILELCIAFLAESRLEQNSLQK
jgi:hypothetical protein